MDVAEELDRFLAEDLGSGDWASRAIAGQDPVRARIISRGHYILAGASEVSLLFERGDARVQNACPDGSPVGPGTIVMDIRGPGEAVLSRERTALNLLTIMSGVATSTSAMVEKARSANPNVIIGCTRKTTPGFRYFEKKAVVVGGGWPHRYRLDHSVMIKDNHLTVSGGISRALESLKDAKSPVSNPIRDDISNYSSLYPENALDPWGMVEVEVEDLEQALEAARGGADIIMLDNMDPPLARECADAIRGVRPEILIEVSGGIKLDNVERYAPIADIISSGWIVLGAPAADMSMEIILPDQH
jgi:nicotinate-nucleotide pyrophosphorylase (carboxylating)